MSLQDGVPMHAHFLAATHTRTEPVRPPSEPASISDFLPDAVTSHVRKRRLGGMMFVRHKATRKTALGIRTAGGTIIVQFDDPAHLKRYGWHLYPRHHFEQWRGRYGRKRSR
jgi:hypothetical protein